MSDYGVAFVRTATPVVVGWLTSTVLGPFVDPAVATEAVAALVALLYYGVVRAFESSGLSRAGWLLGFPAQPLYRIDTQVLAEATQVDDDAVQV